MKPQGFDVFDIGHDRVTEPSFFLDKDHDEPESQRGGFGPF